MVNHKLDVSGVIVEVNAAAVENQKLTEFIETHPTTQADAQIVIEAGAQGLSFQWFQANAKPLVYFIDVQKFVNQQRSYPAAKQGAFNQALGKHTQTILDATAGWGSDALLMCAQGYTVTLLERNPIMALLLDDAMQRLALTDWAQDNRIPEPRVIEVDAIDYLQTTDCSAIDCVYLDPMFPDKRKKSAASNKYMQFLQWLLAAENDANQLAAAAIDSVAKRVVVKRPDYAEPLHDSPSHQCSSKLLHYDVYVNH